MTTKDFLVFQIKETAAQVREFYKGKKTIEEVKMEKMIMVIVGTLRWIYWELSKRNKNIA